MMTTQPKTVVITGASRGIGELTAKLLAVSGHKVYATMRDTEGRNAKSLKDLSSWAKQLKVDLTVIELDVTSPESVDTAIKSIETRDDIDVLINNAGTMPVGVTEAFSLEQTKSYFDVNMFGIVSTTQGVLPNMRKRKSGLIINISSSAGRLSIPYFGIYCASKWAVEAYTESLHYELAPFNIECILIEPSGHATDLVDSSPSPARDKVLESYGELAQGREKLLGMFSDLFEQGNERNNAQNVADRILNLIEMKDLRPLRTQVGDDMGVSAINDATAPIQSNLIKQLSDVYAVSN